MTAIAFIPSTPLLVPDVSVDSSAELDALRLACSQAISVLVGNEPSAVAIVAPGPTTRILAGPLTGSFHGFGVDQTVTTARDSSTVDAIPVWWTTALGVHALSRADWNGDVIAVEVGPSAADVDEAVVGLVTQLGDGRTWAVVVVGDGSAALSVKAPGYLIPGAEDVDRALVGAVLSADFDGLRNTDLEQAHWAMVGGAGVWATIARAVAALGATSAGATITALYDDTPLGVRYVVATWNVA